MNKILLISIIVISLTKAFGNHSSDNVFIGKTSPRSGAAAIATVIGVDQSVLIQNAKANGKMKCKKAGFQYCYAIDNTFDSVQDESGFYHQILVEGFHEVPEKYKPAPSNRICYLIEKKQSSGILWLSESTYYEYYTYYTDTKETSQTRYLDERGDVGLHAYDVNRIQRELIVSGACDEWRNAPSSNQKEN